MHQQQTKNSIICLLLSMMLLAVLCPPALAAKAPVKIRVAFPLQPDICERDDQGNYSGYTYDYLQKIAEFTGWEYEWIVPEDAALNESISEAMQLVKAGDADLLGCMLKNDALIEDYEYAKLSYGTVYTSLASLQNDTQINETSYMLFSPLRVAVQKKASVRIAELEAFVKSSDLHYELIECADEAGQYDALISGKADVMLRISLVRIPGTKQIAFFAPRPFYFVGTKGNEKLMTQLNQAIANLNKAFPNFQRDLFNKYFNTESARFEMNQAEQLFLQQKKTLRVLCVPNAAPFIYQYDAGRLGGSSYLLMNDFAQATGLQVEYDVFDPSQSFAATMQSGKYDCALGIPCNAAANPSLGLISSAPYAAVSTVMFAHADISQIPEQKRVVALVSNSSLASQVNAMAIKYYPTLADCIKAVAHGDADCGYGNSRSVDYYTHDLYADLAVFPSPFAGTNACIALVRESDNTLLQLVNRYICSLSDSDLYLYSAQAIQFAQKSSFAAFARSNPGAAVGLLTALLVLLMLAVILFVLARYKNRKNMELARASNAKFDFLSRMSHDMRTPMNAMIGMAELGESEKSIVESKKYFKNIKVAGKYLLGLINDTLDMNKMESKLIALHPEPVSCAEVAHTVESLLFPRAKEKRLDFTVSTLAESNQPVLLDRLRIQQIIVNLATNAIKFTPAGGKVEIVIEGIFQPNNKMLIRLIVRDNGIGIGENFISKMFLPFEQERRSLPQAEEGAGLGLSIVKNLVELMSGTITAKSKPGKGSEFTVQLECERSAQLPAAAIVTEEEPDFLMNKRVLLCEDHILNIEVAKRLLQKQGILVDVATNGKEGLAMFAKSALEQYDAILMDIRMPVMDGLEAAKAIRALNRADARSVPIIAMTANAYEEDVEHSRAAGMNEHLAKPVEPALLYQTLRAQIRARQSAVHQIA
ncbi:MAG: transporter substrate-binding domain-containing protein [Clostridia bacterium]